MFESLEVDVRSERSSRKEPFTDRDVRALLARVRRVIVAKGKKTIELEAGKARPADLKGPTGNYRAPMVLRGKSLLVGFHREALRDLVTADEIDREAFEAMRVKHIEMADAASRTILAALTEALEVLTPEQRADLAEQLANHHPRR